MQLFRDGPFYQNPKSHAAAFLAKSPVSTICCSTSSVHRSIFDRLQLLQTHLTRGQSASDRASPNFSCRRDTPETLREPPPPPSFREVIVAHGCQHQCTSSWHQWNLFCYTVSNDEEMATVGSNDPFERRRSSLKFQSTKGEGLSSVSCGDIIFLFFKQQFLHSQKSKLESCPAPPYSFGHTLFASSSIKYSQWLCSCSGRVSSSTGAKAERSRWSGCQGQGSV